LGTGFLGGFADPERALLIEFVYSFVAAFGVFWKVVEFAIAEIALATGAPRVLTQYGLGGTMKDPLFNLGGAVRGTAHRTDVAGAIETRLEARSDAD
jgi:hypothetical protein